MTSNGHIRSDSVQAEETAHDWEEEQRKNKDLWDDGTQSFFWRTHTVSVLFLSSAILLYVAVFEDQTTNSLYNQKRGVLAVILAFVLFGVTHTPDGPFVRPHPAFWRLVVCLSVVYELALVFLLFQISNFKLTLFAVTPTDARRLLSHIDKNLGHPMPEKDYGGNCRIYDPSNKLSPWQNVLDKMDGFVVVHFFGWWLKTLILRDWWLCMVISIMFELLEYTLEHQLPNFHECWWDHWIMDALICNSGGIYLGMKTLNYLSMKPYHWRGMWNIPTYRGKLTRILKQFTPYVWTEFDWKPTSSLKRWFAMVGVIIMFLLAELNTFYLKYVLWIPPPHFLCLGRLLFFLFMGAGAMREAFEFLDNPKCKKFGTQSWVILLIINTEFLLSLKFDWNTLTKPLPWHITLFWLLAILFFIGWTTWHFYLQRLLRHTEQQLDQTVSTPSGKSGKMALSDYNHNKGEMRQRKGQS